MIGVDQSTLDGQLRQPTDGDFRPKRFLVVCHAWYGDVIGGSFRLATEFSLDLAASRHEVHYVCCQPSNNSQLDNVEKIKGVTVHRYRVPPESANGWQRMRHHVQETRRVTERLGQTRPFDVLHGHSPLQFAGAVQTINSSAQSVYVVHSPFVDELRSNAKKVTIRSRIAGWAASQIERRNLVSADCVQTDSEYTLHRLSTLYPRAIRGENRVAPGWVDADRFQSSLSREELRALLGREWATDLPIFFTLRRLEARMGLETLIDSAGELLAQGRQFKLLIGGGGSLFSALTARIKRLGIEGSVKLLGRLEEEHLPSFYAAADCFVLPTMALECFGLIVLEAFAAGTPVIASRVAAIPELATIQGEEWLFEPGDVRGLSACLTNFLDGQLCPHPSLRTFAEQYDRRTVVAKWEQLALGK